MKELSEASWRTEFKPKSMFKRMLRRYASASVLAETEGFNPINLSEAIDREIHRIKNLGLVEYPGESPICCLEGQEGHGKSWLAAKAMNSICDNENIVAFWLDSKEWNELQVYI